jgi:hypothetical protein
MLLYYIKIPLLGYDRENVEYGLCNRSYREIRRYNVVSAVSPLPSSFCYNSKKGWGCPLPSPSSPPMLEFKYQNAAKRLAHVRPLSQYAV